MLATFLLPDQVVRENGASPAVALGAASGKPVLLTLGITRIIEQQSLDVQIWGSPDGETWSAEPLLSFPQKFYCGTYALLLDLSRSPEVKFVKAQWKMQRWGRGEPTPLFGFYLFAKELTNQTVGAVA
jgi:hypothetical protein